MSGWQLAGDAPTAYTRFARKFLKAWTDDPRLVAGFMGATPVAGQFLALPDDRRQAFLGPVVDLLVSYLDDAGLVVQQQNHFLTAALPT
jgi:hypothetical protein